MSINTQEIICKAFGYESPLGVNIMTSSAKQANAIELVNDNNEPCSMCGQVHTVGYKAKNGKADDLLKALISDTYNECYSLSVSNFVCEYCAYSLKAYGSPSKMEYGKKMVNVLIKGGKAIEKSFNSDDKNDLFNILLNPPKTPFVILINSRGTVLENLVFNAKATLSKELIVVNYGLNNLEVNPNEVFQSIEDAKRIANKYGIEINSDSIWNRADEVSIQVKRKGKNGLISLEDFFVDMGIFIEEYNRDCRLVAKMILAAYLKANPISKVEKKSVNVDAPKEVSNTTSKTSLFDF
ncbi:MAG: hypothetical protein PHS65_03870 [Arcobacteraceae bacterium]|nr:hypothetical protein [Arcobacteraceae bacterium]